MAVVGTPGSVSVQLHPLVVMNISDHWTRVRAQQGKAKSGIVFVNKQFFNNFDSVKILFDYISLIYHFTGSMTVCNSFKQ